jgi:hypothetical protein
LYDHILIRCYLKLIHIDAIRYKCGQDPTKPGSKPSDICIGKALYLVPSDGLRWWGAFLSDTTAAALLILVVLALRDKNNFQPEAKMQGLIAGLAVTALGLAMGLNTGGATNPARDFGPRLAAACFGVHSWGSKHWWSIWGPWLVPFFGAFIGASIYKFFIKPIILQKAAMLKEKYDHEADEQTVRQAILNQNAAGQTVEALQAQLAEAREREEEAAKALDTAKVSIGRSSSRIRNAQVHE